MTSIDDYGAFNPYNDARNAYADFPVILTNTTRPGDAPDARVRTFDTGATRDTDANKLDFEGFLSPLVLKAYAEYMHAKRKMPDGSMRDSDNWQLGIPVDAYMKSMWRHFFDVWSSYREGSVDKVELLALLFNVMGLLHETLKTDPL